MREAPSLQNIFKSRKYSFRGLGANGVALTLQEGKAGVDSLYISEGKYKLRWAEHPGRYIKAIPGLAGTDPALLKNWSVGFVPYNTTTRELEIWIHNSAGTLADLVADQYLYLEVEFAETEV
jgi:hypothetical protein